MVKPKVQRRHLHERDLWYKKERACISAKATTKEFTFHLRSNIQLYEKLDIFQPWWKKKKRLLTFYRLKKRMGPDCKENKSLIFQEKRKALIPQLKEFHQGLTWCGIEEGGIENNSGGNENCEDDRSVHRRTQETNEGVHRRWMSKSEPEERRWRSSGVQKRNTTSQGSCVVSQKSERG